MQYTPYYSDTICLVPSAQKKETSGINDSCWFLTEEEGIEPPLTVLETAALPLYYSSLSNSASSVAEVDYSIRQYYYARLFTKSISIALF